VGDLKLVTPGLFFDPGISAYDLLLLLVVGGVQTVTITGAKSDLRLVVADS
jgi:hypothetical protein